MLNSLVPPRRGEPIVDQEGRASRRMTEYMELNSSIVNQTRTEVVEIGDWNMNAMAAISVAHGLEYADIVSAEVFVRNDADTAKYNIGAGVSPVDATPQGYVGEIDSTNVDIIRITGGSFDSASYQASSYNRGWLIITCINQ